MEERGGADALWLVLERDTVGKLGILEVLDAGEMLVDQRGVGEWPEMLSRLQLRGVGRQEEQVDVVGDAEPQTGMPARAIEHQHDLFARPRADLARKLRQLHFKQRDTDGGGQVKEGPTRGGMDKADQIPPREAVLDRGHWPLANRRPDAPQEWFEADPMFVGRPQLDGGMGKRGGHGLQQRPYFFLKCACCSGSAKACCGRGSCWLCLSRCR